jgi:hypothetical protein
MPSPRENETGLIEPERTGFAIKQEPAGKGIKEKRNGQRGRIGETIPGLINFYLHELTIQKKAKNRPGKIKPG